MKSCNFLLLPVAFLSLHAWGQEVSFNSSTLLQYWRQGTPGFETSTYSPATQFLEVDATGLGQEAISFHFYGWGRSDLAEQTRVTGKNTSDMVYGYVSYRAPKGNLEAQVGRIAVNQGVAIEQVDGGTFRADLIGGFTFSAFAGVPVHYRIFDESVQHDYEYQRDLIAGGRLGKRFDRFAELGLSFVQDGTYPGKKLNGYNTYDFTRRQMAVDIRVTPNTLLNMSGRTVFDIADRMDLPADTQANNARVAEHDYNLALRLNPQLGASLTYTERNFRAFYSGTTLPSLFNPQEPGTFRSQGVAFFIGAPTSRFQGVVDLKKTHRDSYGDSLRYGGELRGSVAPANLKYGVGLHRVNADAANYSGIVATFYGLAHTELQGWVTYEKDRMTAAFNAIHHHFDDPANPSLYGKGSLSEIVGALGYQATPDLKVSCDVIRGVSSLMQAETLFVMRADYHFGWARKEGVK